MMMIGSVIVIDAPGYYGDEGGRVYSSHRSLEAARRAARKHAYTDERGNRRIPVAVAWNLEGYTKGDSFYRSMPPQIVVGG
jgi:hypothetical protein